MEKQIISYRTILIGFFLILIVNSLYSTGCTSESSASNRLCPQGTNATEYILNLKKGGSNILSTADYKSTFFPCQEYTYDCGYVETQDQALSIANGIQLAMTQAKVDQILPLNNTLALRIKPYLNLSAEGATCVQKVFPLILTADESNLFFTNYMNLLVTQIKNKYSSEKETTSLSWANLNVNIKTAVSMAIKQDQTFMLGTFWTLFKQNDFESMSLFLKAFYTKTNELYFLRSAYLIDSVIQVCNKYQSVNFLIDESGSITAPSFKLGQDFLTQYFTDTFDDPTISSIHYFDTTFEQYLGYGNSKQQLLDGIAAKLYRGLGTYTGLAINKTVALIQAANFQKAVPKILIVMTDGKSTDQVLQASNYARSKGITMISVGIGSGVNTTQLLQIAQTSSNVINVVGYSDLSKLVDFISNYFCKQIINIGLGETIANNQVRVPESPSYFRVEKSPTDYYQLFIDYQTDPKGSGQELYSSQYDPLPDSFTDQSISQAYEPSPTQRLFFVEPIQNISIRTKKESFTSRQIKNSFVSVGGINLNFNISLLPCQTSQCTDQRKVYEKVVVPIGPVDPLDPTNTVDPIVPVDPTDPTDNNIEQNTNSVSAQGKDYNIYIYIIASILGLICSAMLGIGALKKFYGQQEILDQIKINSNIQRMQPELTEYDIHENVQPNQNNQIQRNNEFSLSGQIQRQY